MKLSICTDVFGDLPFDKMLDRVSAYGLDAIEMTAGGWGACNYIHSAKELLDDKAKRDEFFGKIKAKGLEVSALNCSGNYLLDIEPYKTYSETARDTIRLAGEVGIDTVVMMSGLPAGAPGDTAPNWFVTTRTLPVLPSGSNYMIEGIKYQFDVAAKWWRETLKIAKEAGVRIAIEEFPCMLVHNVRTFFELVDAIGENTDILGLNLDPSHLFIQGADPIAAARALGDKIFYCHGKDARPERGNVDINGLLDNLTIEELADRNWNYVAVGCGHDLMWWKEFFSVLSMLGYNSYVSLEMEDLTMSVDAGIETSIDALKATISK